MEALKYDLRPLYPFAALWYYLMGKKPKIDLLGPLETNKNVPHDALMDLVLPRHILNFCAKNHKVR